MQLDAERRIFNGGSHGCAMSKAPDTSCDTLMADTEDVTSAKNQDYSPPVRLNLKARASASRDQSEPLLMEPLYRTRAFLRWCKQLIRHAHRGTRDIRNANAEK